MKMAMKDNLARQYNHQVNYQAQAQPQPNHRPSSQREVRQPGGTVIRRTLIDQKRLSKIEKFTIGAFSAGFVSLMIASVSMSSTLTSVSQEVQDLNQQIEQTTVENTNLEQNVQELSRYDRVYQIGKEKGLENNDSQIRNVQ